MAKSTQNCILICILLAFVATTFLSPLFAVSACATADNVDQLQQALDGIVEWKTNLVGGGKHVLSDKFWQKAGQSTVDWYAFAFARAGIAVPNKTYAIAENAFVVKQYLTANKLDSVRSTEWHRATLCLAACGADPTACGEGNVNLVADGVYNCTDDSGNGTLDKQGVNGLLWGLLALDSKVYAVPNNAVYTREKLVEQILSLQHDDGGFGLGEQSEIDLTATAVTALAPYYLQKISLNVQLDVSSAVDNALQYLSAQQQDDGDFCCYGQSNCESTAEVIVALCSLGIDPSDCVDFTKNGNTTIDGLTKYRNDDGGFLHAVDGGKSNDIATVQALRAIVALLRHKQGQTAIYDLSDVESVTLNQPNDNSCVAIVITSVVAVCVVCAVVFVLVKKRSSGRNVIKNCLFFALLAVVVVVVALTVDIQTVDQYYLSHIDDVTDDSETVTISISCSTVFDNWDSLDNSLKADGYIPVDGIILDSFELVLRKNDTVYDILNRVTRHFKIVTDSVTTPIDGGVYVKGIARLYEFDCGQLSGWMYLVNGQVASCACDKYVLKDGDVVQWVYSCDLGCDVVPQAACQGGACIE